MLTTISDNDDQKVELKVRRAASEYSNAVKHYNDASKRIFRDFTIFHNRIGLLSGTAISLSIGLLINLYAVDNQRVNQYSGLYLLGIFLLFWGLVCGFGYRYVVAKSSWCVLQRDLLDTIQKYANVEYAAIKDGYIIGVEDESVSVVIDRIEKIHDKGQGKYKLWDVPEKIMDILGPVSFLLGSFFISLYFIIQVFDF